MTLNLQGLGDGGVLAGQPGAQHCMIIALRIVYLWLCKSEPPPAHFNILLIFY